MKSSFLPIFSTPSVYLDSFCSVRRDPNSVVTNSETKKAQERKTTYLVYCCARYQVFDNSKETAYAAAVYIMPPDTYTYCSRSKYRARMITINIIILLYNSSIIPVVLSFRIYFHYTE